MLGLQGFSSNRQEREREIMSGEKTTKGKSQQSLGGAEGTRKRTGCVCGGVSNGKNRPGVCWEYS